jgi:hypothetical protein
VLTPLAKKTVGFSAILRFPFFNQAKLGPISQKNRSSYKRKKGPSLPANVTNICQKFSPTKTAKI